MAQAAKRRVVPRDAASLILIDRSGPVPRVLVGRRAAAHRFMPNLYVFPGGRRDPLDHRLATLEPLADDVVTLLARRVPKRRATSLHGLGVTALRELHEETGLVIGRFDPPVPGAAAASIFAPALGKLRYTARAITPPTFPMRFDTRFFTLFTDEVAIDPTAARDSRELEDLRWIGIDDRQSVPLPDITATILDDLAARLSVDPHLSFERGVPFYYTVRGRFVRTML
ncbi:NUDIX domain-containing protein [Rhizobium sp. RU20A]|uniref:NUDIX hydrolase n=1 Tax=Rhizobium sp. RU20A TaxID=1907412 RepID=UPI00165FB8AF|nr:NUDIX domain-containing protein [Rhizobium sp. RU20A]